MKRSPLLRDSSLCATLFGVRRYTWLILAVVIRNLGPEAQMLVTRALQVIFSLPGRPRQWRTMRLVQHRDDLTSNANRLVFGDL